MTFVNLCRACGKPMRTAKATRCSETCRKASTHTPEALARNAAALVARRPNLDGVGVVGCLAETVGWHA